MITRTFETVEGHSVSIDVIEEGQCRDLKISTDYYKEKLGIVCD